MSTESDASQILAHPAVRRVQDALTAAGASGTPVVLAEYAPTAATAAAQLDCTVAAIANSLVFSADGEPLLVLTSGGHRVDTAKVAALLGVAEVGRADADLVRAATGMAIGGVAPVGGRLRDIRGPSFPRPTTNSSASPGARPPRSRDSRSRHPARLGRPATTRPFCRARHGT